MKESLEQIKNQILNSERILIITHTNPDGDAFGSLLALMLGLKKLKSGKHIEAICDYKIPELFRFLPALDQVSSELGARDLVITLNAKKTAVDKVSYSLQDDLLELYITPTSGRFSDSDIGHYFGKPNLDLVIALDCGEIERIGKLYSDEKDFFSEVPIINIDHHQDNTMFGKINYVDTEAAATAQILYKLMLYLGIEIDHQIATALLTGIISDTGNFQYSSTTPETFLIASKLLETGAQHQVIVEQMYRMKKYTTLKLWGNVLAKIRNTEDQKIVWSTVNTNDLQNSGANLEEAEGVLDELMSTIPQAEIIVLFYEQANEIRVSIRSVDSINAAKLAGYFGGGGHAKAAGFRLSNIQLEQAEQHVIKRISELFREGVIREVNEQTPTAAVQQSAYTPEQIIEKIGDMLNKDKELKN